METNNKLREALKDIWRLVEQIHFLHSDYPSEIHDIARKVNAALAEPVKNCEVGTPGEQGRRFTEFCYKNRNAESCCGDCPAFKRVPRGAECEFAWAQMPYESEAQA